ncbi:MAG: zinc metallopeptidase [Ruminococcaceae bacterium]|nr:zinc metallopeptidase [Oscillospiraceae bacterium]
MYIDPLYIILVMPAVILAFIAQIGVKTTFSKYSKVSPARRITGEDAARAVLRANGVEGVRFEYVAGDLTDHFDPKTNTIRLSGSVGSASSIAAIGVAAHEAGHAVQHAKGYALIKFRMAIIPITNIGSMLAFPLILIGILIEMTALAYLGIAFFGFSTVFQLVTLPVELNASKRAVQAIKNEGLLDGDELKGAKKTLTAAAMTYLAALFVSVMQLLRLVLMVGGSRRRD